MEKLMKLNSQYPFLSFGLCCFYALNIYLLGMRFCEVQLHALTVSSCMFTGVSISYNAPDGRRVVSAHGTHFKRIRKQT